MRLALIATVSFSAAIVAVFSGCSGGPGGNSVSPATEAANPTQTLLSMEHHRRSVIECVLHSFGAPGDGELPTARLLNINGVLYGTTSAGGSERHYGTVFTILPSGQEQIIYDGSNSNGDEMMAGLVDVNGVLYGTAESGGGSSEEVAPIFGEIRGAA
jgi:hypothetical protein